jgi:hypothetical protein
MTGSGIFVVRKFEAEALYPFSLNCFVVLERPSWLQPGGLIRYLTALLIDPACATSFDKFPHS